MEVVALGLDDGNDDGNELEEVSEGVPFTVGLCDDDGDALGVEVN